MVESSNDGKEGEIKEESSPKEEKVCPICAFIEAGPCAEEHKVRVCFIACFILLMVGSDHHTGLGRMSRTVTRSWPRLCRRMQRYF